MGNVNAQQGKLPAKVADSSANKDTDEEDSTDFDKVFVRVEKEERQNEGRGQYLKFLGCAQST